MTNQTTTLPFSPTQSIRFITGICRKNEDGSLTITSTKNLVWKNDEYNNITAMYRKVEYPVQGQYPNPYIVIN